MSQGAGNKVFILLILTLLVLFHTKSVLILVTQQLGEKIVQKICCTVKSSVEIHQLVLFDRPRMLQTLFIVHHVPSCSLYTTYPHG